MSATLPHSSADPARCEAALAAALKCVEPVRANGWRMPSADPAFAALTAQLTDGFLVLATEIPRERPVSDWELLRRNGALAGLAKYVAGADGTLGLRAEIPVHADGHLSPRVARAVAAFAATLRRPQALGDRGSRPAAEAAVSDLPALLVAAGWPATSARPDRCAVPLDSRRGAPTAVISAHAGQVRLSTELGSWDELCPPSRAAIARLLLSANALVRMARTLVVEDDAGVVAELEVVFEGRVAAAEMRCALEALSVGADLCAREVDVLQNEPAAELFLAARGVPGEGEDSQRKTKRKL